MTKKNATRNKAGKSVRNSEVALRGKCVLKFDPGRVELGGIAASLAGVLAKGSPRHVCEVLLTAGRQRVTYNADTDGAFTVVYHQRGGIVFWDNATRSVATIAADRIPRTEVAASKTLEVSTREGKEETTFVVTTGDADAGKMRHELTVSRRKEWAAFGPALMRVLHCGQTCHERSGLPWERIAKAGLIVRERSSAGDGRHDPISELSFESLELVKVSDRDFVPPRGFLPLEELLKTGVKERPVPPTREEAPTPDEIQAAVIKQALEGDSGSAKRALRVRDRLTPDCLGSTRFGSVTATIHQDLLTAASNAVNVVAPLLGPTTITGGTWTVPWLANMEALPRTAPGSGLFCFLREPRNPASPPGPAGGGRGFLDRLAYGLLYERDTAGQLRTQREFSAGTLPATLASWGVGAPANANLLAASGELRMLSFPDQRVITERYETAEIGVFRIGGLPSTMGPFPFGSMILGSITTPPLFTVGITGIAGTVNFASLGGGPLVTAATVGNSGNFVLGLRLPTTTFAATVTRSLTPFGGLVLTVGTVGLCLLFPTLCPLMVVLAVLAAFVLTNVTAVTATLTSVTWTLDVRFEYDSTTERVEPFVSLLGRTGTVAVGTFGRTPNLIANAVDALVAAFGNLFDQWGALFAEQGRKAIQSALRELGMQLPVAGRQNELAAIDGDAQSSTGAVLQLSADIRPVDDVASQPFTTQVVARDAMRQQLLLAHLNIRRDLNPQPVPPPPGPGPALAVATFVGLGLSQNALNYYVFQQWVRGRFEAAITDPAVIQKLVGTAPKLFARMPVRIHMWPATPPRIEIAPREIVNGTRPLIVYFDDVRACFEVPNSQGSDGAGPFAGLWELSCNFKTTATMELAWPWVFSLRIDPPRTSSGSFEPRTWEFIDPNAPAVMATVTPQNLAALVDLIAEMLIAPISAAGVRAPAAVRPWTRPLPAMQQEIFPVVQPPAPLRPQQAYLEMLARRKALYILPAIDTLLLELVDGSGSPLLNTLVLPLAGAPGPLPTTPLAMTCPQGTALRDFLLPLIGLPEGP